MYLHWISPQCILTSTNCPKHVVELDLSLSLSHVCHDEREHIECVSRAPRARAIQIITAPPQLTHMHRTRDTSGHIDTRACTGVSTVRSTLHMNQRERQPTGCDTDTSLPPSLCLSHVQPARKVLPAAVHRLCSLGVPAGGRAVASAQ